MLLLGLLLWAVFFLLAFALPVFPWWLWLAIFAGGALAVYLDNRHKSYK